MCSEENSKPRERLTFKERIRRISRFNNSPREIALGVGLGVFIAVIPLYGLHTIMVIIAALLIKRVNKIAILLGTNISTTITFPFITWAGYTIGRLMLGDRYPALQWSTFKKFSYKTLLHFYYPLFIGSVLLAFLLGALLYYLTLWIIIKRRKAGGPAQALDK